MHLDLLAADADRRAGLGARVLASRADWITLADPEGNEFCIQRVRPPAPVG